MAKGAKEVDIVAELETLESFNEFIRTKTGLVVCEAYQDWAGPCVVMKRFLKKAKFELLEGDENDLVQYCSVKVDLVPAFKNLKGKCVPTYLFFAEKSLLHIFRGHEASRLMPLIRDLVKREKECIAGRAKRKAMLESMPYEFPAADPSLPPLELIS